MVHLWREWCISRKRGGRPNPEGDRSREVRLTKRKRGLGGPGAMPWDGGDRLCKVWAPVLCLGKLRPGVWLEAMVRLGGVRAWA